MYMRKRIFPKAVKNMTLPTIETERLILRQITPDDAEAVFEFSGDDRVTKYMHYCTYDSSEQIREWIENLDEDIFAIVRKSDDLIIGTGGISPDARGDDFWGFGYNFRYDCWGNGYATEAVKAMIKYAHENFGVRKFCSSHAEENPASGRVMEKCGLKFDRYGTFRKMDGSLEMRSKIYVGFIEDMPYVNSK